MTDARSIMELTSDSARDLGRTFHMESDSRFTVGSWRMRLVEEEPTIEAAQAGEFAGGGAGLDSVLA